MSPISPVPSQFQNLVRRTVSPSAFITWKHSVCTVEPERRKSWKLVSSTTVLYGWLVSGSERLYFLICAESRAYCRTSPHGSWCSRLADDAHRLRGHRVEGHVRRAWLRVILVLHSNPVSRRQVGERHIRRSADIDARHGDPRPARRSESHDSGPVLDGSAVRLSSG